MCGSSTGQPVMTYKDGSIFDSGAFMTTTDSLQLIWSYCNGDADQGWFQSFFPQKMFFPIFFGTYSETYQKEIQRIPFNAVLMIIWM